jgi:tetratricopeptide (TPR) repeat protein
MRKPLSGTVLLTLGLLTAGPAVWGQQPPRPKKPASRTGPPVISTRQIDRYDAITALQQRVKENPNSLADWIILGELAHEVALDLPADQATRYYRISRDAYEKALALKPDQPGLKAAVQFAKDHEAHAYRFEERKDEAIKAYLEARRRDLEATRYTPSLPVYGQTQVLEAVPTTTRTTTTTTTIATPVDISAPVAPPAAPVLPPPNGVQVPERAAAAAIVAADPDPALTPPTAAQRDTANLGTRQFYSYVYPIYQPYYVQGAPYTYQQYTTTYTVPGVTTNSVTSTPPVTVQRYLQQLPAYPGWQSGNPFR